MNLEELSRIGRLGSLSTDTRKRLMSVVELRRIPSDSTLYRIEDPPGGMYGLADGFVDVLPAPAQFKCVWFTSRAMAGGQEKQRQPRLAADEANEPKSITRISPLRIDEIRALYRLAPIRGECRWLRSNMLALGLPLEVTC